MAIAVRAITAEELNAHRDKILASLGLTRDELDAKMQSGSLVGTEWTSASEIEDIDYLLGA